MAKMEGIIVHPAPVAPVGVAPNGIAIASGKGGVGKTWLSITLSHSLARSGRHVLLFDGDIGLANIDVQLGLNPKRSLTNVLSGKTKLIDAVTHYEPGRFDVIAGRSGSIAHLPEDRLESLKQGIVQLARQYDVAILDLGAGIDAPVRELTHIARTCLVVVTDEPTSLTDAYAFIKLCKAQSVFPDIQIVVNQAATHKEGQRTYEAIYKACDSFLKLRPRLAGIIRKDNKVRDAIRAQTPLLERTPGCTAATDVAALAVRLLTQG